MDDTSPLSVSDFCNLDRKVEKISIRPGAVMGREISRCDIIRGTHLLPPRAAGGYDYARQYVEEEERILLKGQRLDAPLDPCGLTGSSRSDSCQMEDITSIGSLPNLGDVDDEETVQIYDRYKFTPRKSGLPIQKERETIVRMVDTNQVVIILGSTGCGKTTQVPQYILDHHAKTRKRCNIIVTQPRRIAASSVARRVCDERDWQLSTIVGYQIGLDNRTSSDTRLTYCTTGVLREKLVRDRSMMAYTHIILDEVHERDMEMDFLMLIVRKLLRSNSRTVKVILMSATIDPTHFAKYFSLPIGNVLCPAPVLDIEKLTNFKVGEFYINQLKLLGTIPKFDVDDPQISDLSFDIAVRLIMRLDSIDFETFQIQYGRKPSDQDNYKPAVLVFLPGIHEIEEMFERLDEKSRGNSKYLWHIIPLHSSITRKEQNQVFQLPSDGYRKVILSTNIAESSITVPDVEYVIDFCLTKHLVCDPVTNFTSLRLTWASHSNCKQRAGRAGRVKDGRVYRMVPQYFYEEMLPLDCDPEMKRCPLTQTVLKAKMLKMGDPKQILAMALDPPDQSSLETTILLLKEAGALLMTCEGKPTQYDGDITFLGTVMSNLPLDIQLSKLIMLGHVFSILEDTIVMAAWMTVRNVFVSDFSDRLGPYSSKIGFTGGTGSDCISYLHIHQMYKEKLRTNYFKTSRDTEGGFCKRQFLNVKAMHEANELVEELRKRLSNLGVDEIAAEGRVKWHDAELPFIRKIVIAGAFYPYYFVRNAQGGQVDEQDAVKVLSGKDPYSTVYVQGMPPNQEIQLYAKCFKDHFEKYAGLVSDVTCDGSSKVYIEFKQVPNKDIPGKICYPVYRAIKARQLRIPLVVPMLSEEAARKRIEQLGIVSGKYLTLGNQETKTVSRLPSMHTQFVDFVPCWVIDPNHFWIQRIIDQNDLKSLQLSLNRPGNTSAVKEKPLQIGGIYVAPYPPGSSVLYRVLVVAINDSVPTAHVFFIDYGNEDSNMPIKHIFEIGPNIADLKCLDIVPPFALECTLAGIGPSTLKNKNGIWSNHATQMFQKLIQRARLQGEVYSVVDGVLSLKITDEGSQTVNDKLVEAELAVKVPERHRSVVDNKERETVRASDSDWGTKNKQRAKTRGYEWTEKTNWDGLGEESHQSRILKLDVHEVKHNFQSVTQFYEPPTRNETHNFVTFKGPSSPLEMKVHGCTRSSMGKEVTMDLESVNSVLLDSNPEDPHERLLVAGFVATNTAGNKLKLGHTTLMPNIHGLSSLICLIFAPHVELRVSADKSRYTGALCGLGYDVETKKAHFPENEMEITFDVKIDIKDVEDVNKLRFWMNKPLVTREGDDLSDATPFEVQKTQHEVKRTLLALFSKVREAQEIENFRREYLWHQYDERDLMFLNHQFNQDKRFVYPLHNAFKLRSKE